MSFLKKLFGKSDSANKHENKELNSNLKSQAHSDYQIKLLAIKEFYPFEGWRESYNNGLTQYTQQNCDRIKVIFDDLLHALMELGENGTEDQKKLLFKNAIIRTNSISEEIEDLIETDEREELCELTNRITIACGLDPANYGEGEGLASEWREW